MAKITLFEFNPQGNIQIGPGSEGEEGLLGFTPGEQAETSAETGESEEEGGGGIAKIVVPLVALVAIAAAVRFMGGGESEAEFEEEEAESEGGIQRFTTTTE